MKIGTKYLNVYHVNFLCAYFAAETHFNASSDKGLAEGVLLRWENKINELISRKEISRNTNITLFTPRKILTTFMAKPNNLTNLTDHCRTKTNRRDQSKAKSNQTDQTGKENHKKNDLPYIF